MPGWCFALILLCCNYVEGSAPFPAIQKAKYNNSFRLTRLTRTRVQQLLKTYKEQQLGNRHFEDRSRQLTEMPLLSTDFHSWLKLSDSDRLHAAFLDMQTYWNRLEGKKKQLEKREVGQMAARRGRTLPQSIKHIQLNLRDLMSHVSSQMSNMNNSWMKPTFPTTLSQENNSKTVWESRVEGYIILRDLDLYLTKLARDFLLLASKTQL